VDVADPDVIYANGTWVMYLDELVQPVPRLVMLTSEDGLKFVKKGEVEVKGAVACLIPHHKGYRLYLHAEDFSSILMYTSEDLENWDEGVEVLKKGQEGSLDEYGVGDPAVAKLPDGTYVMIYKTWIQKPERWIR